MNGAITLPRMSPVLCVCQSGDEVNILSSHQQTKLSTKPLYHTMDPVQLFSATMAPGENVSSSTQGFVPT